MSYYVVVVQVATSESSQNNMELPKSVHDAAAVADNLAPPAFKTLVDAVFASLLDPKTSIAPVFEQESISGADQIAMKQAFAGISSIVLEAAKHNVEAAQFLSTLEEQGIQRARATYIAQSFETNRASLRTSLGNISIAFPRVVDIDWRLDYYIKSNTVERVDVPVYLVNLTVQDADDKTRDLTFSASLQELQDMLAKLQDAAKNIERIYQKAE